MRSALMYLRHNAGLQWFEVKTVLIWAENMLSGGLARPPTPDPRFVTHA
jgi:hypothetical protein